jgi:predicted transcriptional regulator
MSEKEVLEGIARIEGLLSTLVKLQMAPVLEHELTDDFARKLWDMTGKATTAEIQKRLKCRRTRISDTWARWDKTGLIKKDGRSYHRIV